MTDPDLTIIAMRGARAVRTRCTRHGVSVGLYLALALSAPIVSADPEAFARALVDAARERTQHHVVYDGSYRRIAYPMGDVPPDVGVCTDLLIRAYRRLGIDLQERVHQDMHANFTAYPQLWGLRSTDTNIDHRRVPNLQAYFARHGTVLPVSAEPRDYAAGDIVTWDLPGNLPHIGIVSDVPAAGSERPMIIHNIGAGPMEEDMLFHYPITGHYRYLQ